MIASIDQYDAIMVNADISLDVIKSASFQHISMLLISVRRLGQAIHPYNQGRGR